MEIIIRAIYNAKLNVQQGIANSTSVTITTVGRREFCVCSSSGSGKAVAQLGIACDVCR
jgi:hypothetical protein